MSPLCHKHAQPTRMEDKKARHYPHIGQSIPQLSVCAIAGLGYGGNGTVYLVEECPTKAHDIPPRQYAMKFISMKVHGFKFVEAYKKEYSYHTRIPSHPNIVRAYAMMETQDSLFLLFEYIGGADFHRFLKNFGRFISRDNLLIKALFLQILDAVAHIHDQGIYHNDLKPENILCNHMEDCSRLMLTDFGASTDRFRICHSDGYVPGTPSYCPPECYPGPSENNRGVVLPSAVDIWSLGIILFIICTNGQFPWECAEEKRDSRYQTFCSEPDSVFENLCISTRAQALLKTIWNSKPEERINIHQLRSMVESISVFTKYRDQDTTLRKAGDYYVLQTYFWQAGRSKPRGHARNDKVHSSLPFTKCLNFFRAGFKEQFTSQEKPFFKSVNWRRKYQNLA